MRQPPYVYAPHPSLALLGPALLGLLGLATLAAAALAVISP